MCEHSTNHISLFERQALMLLSDQSRPLEYIPLLMGTWSDLNVTNCFYGDLGSLPGSLSHRGLHSGQHKSSGLIESLLERREEGREGENKSQRTVPRSSHHPVENLRLCEVFFPAFAPTSHIKMTRPSSVFIRLPVTPLSLPLFTSTTPCPFRPASTLPA